MASQPLAKSPHGGAPSRAEGQLGPGATPIEYVEFWLGAGRTFQALAEDIEADLVGRYPASLCRSSATA